jgi:flagellar basal body-associated protein FliL
MKKLILVLIVLGLVITALGFVGGPWLSFRALRAAAKANDTAGISDVVDFNAVRQSLRAELGGGPDKAPPPSIWQDPVGAIGSLLGTSPKNAMLNVDIYLTPNAFKELTNAAADREPRPKDAPFMAGDLLPGVHGSEVRFWDPHRSRIAVRSPEQGLETIFTFERRSLTIWKLVHIRLPAPRESAIKPETNR